MPIDGALRQKERISKILPADEVEDEQNTVRITELGRIQERPIASIVIPIFNEVNNLHSLFQDLTKLLDSLDQSWEVILVDDGSNDGSVDLLRSIQAIDSRFRVIFLRRNFGQSPAFSAGFDLAQGDIIVTMDADLQYDPNDIPALVNKINEGYDIASGWRVIRQDRLLTRRVPSKIANWLISNVIGVELHDYGCSLKAYRREVLDLTKLYGEMHRFIPALASWIGVKVTEVPVKHFRRQHDKSKYGLGRTLRVILDLITIKFLLDYATRPIQIFGLLGLLSLSGGIVLGIYLSVIKLFFGQPLADRPMLFLVVLLIVVGVQLVIMGLLGELVVRTYHETQGKPTYIIREVLSSDHSETS